MANHLRAGKTINSCCCAIVALIALFSVSGCMGGPAQSILRIQPDSYFSCESTKTATGSANVVFVVRDAYSLPALDRQAVIIADGLVLRPSNAWYWEGTPGEILTQALTAGLRCKPGFETVGPYKPRLEHDYVLKTKIRAFEVDRQNSRFIMAFDLELWSPRAKDMLAQRFFQAEAPISSLGAQNVARAAGQAVNQSLEQAARWLKTEVSR